MDLLAKIKEAENMLVKSNNKIGIKFTYLLTRKKLIMCLYNVKIKFLINFDFDKMFKLEIFRKS